MALPECVTDASTTRIFSNSSAVQYNDGRQLVGSIWIPVTASYEAGEVTGMESSAPGATAQVTFNGVFQPHSSPRLGVLISHSGTSITVFGAQLHGNADGGSVSYVLDGAAALNTTAQLQNSTTPFTSAIFSSPVLPLGVHTLNITNNGIDLIIGYFKVINCDLSIASPVRIAETSSIPILPASQDTSPSTTSTSNTLHAAPPADLPSSGTIVGIAAGVSVGVVLLVLATGCLWARRRARAPRREAVSCAPRLPCLLRSVLTSLSLEGVPPSVFTKDVESSSWFSAGPRGITPPDVAVPPGLQAHLPPRHGT